jgi:hypothetical protein
MWGSSACVRAVPADAAAAMARASRVAVGVCGTVSDFAALRLARSKSGSTLQPASLRRVGRPI